MKSLLARHFRLAARIALALALAAITLLALMPAPEVPVTTFWDKADHVIAFVVLALLAVAAFPQLSPGRQLVPALLGYGASLELIQSLLPTRSGSLLDLAADAVGVALGLGLIALLQPRLAPKAAVE
jgi:VanZ family protein